MVETPTKPSYAIKTDYSGWAYVHDEDARTATENIDDPRVQDLQRECHVINAERVCKKLRRTSLDYEKVVAQIIADWHRLGLARFLSYFIDGTILNICNSPVDLKEASDILLPHMRNVYGRGLAQFASAIKECILEEQILTLAELKTVCAKVAARDDFLRDRSGYQFGAQFQEAVSEIRGQLRDMLR